MFEASKRDARAAAMSAPRAAVTPLPKYKLVFLGVRARGRGRDARDERRDEAPRGTPRGTRADG